MWLGIKWYERVYWRIYSKKLVRIQANISINPYDHVPLHRILIDKKNDIVGMFDLGNHILIIGLVLIVIFVSLNVE